MLNSPALFSLRRPVWPFDVVLLLCIAFFFLTITAMALYPGGTALDAHSRGYEFTVNFFSDLGRTTARNNVPNPVGSVLFFIALFGAGFALALFFLAFSTLFWNSLAQRVMTSFGVVFGLLSAAYFLGVALFPANLHPHEHVFCVIRAFRYFPLAVIFFTGSILLNRSYPRCGVWVFVLFALGLVAYLALITIGPSPLSPDGLMIQATGQKIIVYASLLSVSAQSALAHRYLRNQGPKSLSNEKNSRFD